MSSGKKYTLSDSIMYWNERGKFFSKLKYDGSSVCSPGMTIVYHLFWNKTQLNILKKILKSISIETNKKRNIFLDFGCGDGRLANFLSNKCSSLCCIDISKELIENAKKKNRKFKNVKFEVYNGKQIEYPSENFDCVFLIGVIHHIPYKDQINQLKEIVRVTKTNGYIILTALTKKTDNTRLFHRNSKSWELIFSKEECQKIIDYGFWYAFIIRLYIYFSKKKSTRSVNNGNTISIFEKEISVIEKLNSTFYGMIWKILLNILVILSIPLEMIFMYSCPRSFAQFHFFVFKKGKMEE